MALPAITTVFFDLGDTLGIPVLSPPPAVHLTDFRVFHWAWSSLEESHSRGLRLGIISNTGDDDGRVVDAVLKVPIPEGVRTSDAAIKELLDFFEASLRIYSKDVGLRKDSRAIFDLACKRAGVAPAACLFVGEKGQERFFAEEAGMRTVPDPRLVTAVLDE